jgi:hypothetical protein
MQIIRPQKLSEAILDVKTLSNDLFFFLLIFIFLELISSFLVYFYFSSLAIDQLGQIICAIYRFLTIVYWIFMIYQTLSFVS